MVQRENINLKKKKKKYNLTLIIPICLIFLLFIIFLITICDYTKGEKIYVNADNENDPNQDGTADHPYDTIKEGIKDAKNGDTILVYDGVYNEEVHVNKRVNLTAKNLFTGVIIDGEGKNDWGILILSNQINVSGFVIKNFTKSGINIDTNYNRVENCELYDNKDGIYITNKHNNIISNCEIYNNEQNGIFVSQDATNNKIIQCKLVNNYYTGISLATDSEDNEISNCICDNNIQNGIQISYAKKNRLYNNTISNNSKYGIWIDSGYENLIFNNTVTKNSINGIRFITNKNNIIENCSIINNSDIGIYFGNGDENEIINSTFYGNRRSIYLNKFSENNYIYHNNFINGTNNNPLDYGVNNWDNSTEGNHWSDYTGEDPDEDGIGNTPYFIDGGANKDNFPLMKPVGTKNELPIVEFDFIPENPSDLDEIEFIDYSLDLDGKIVSWLWEFGDGETSEQQNPKHKYEDNGPFQVNLTVTDDSNGKNISSKIIMVTNVLPDVNFSFSPKEPTTDDLIKFVDDSKDSDGTIKSWYWEFGDGSISLDKNPTHQYSNNGTYVVNLTVRDDDNDSNISIIEIIVQNLPPQTSFSYTPIKPIILNEIQFNDESIDSDGIIISWIWDFGDGNNSNEKNPKHQFIISDTYLVNLTVIDDDGAENYSNQEIIVIMGDDLPPKNPTFSPANGEKVNTKRPKITITFAEEVIITNAKLNSLEISDNLDTNDYIIFTYTPSSDLQEGENTISIKAKDLNGNEMTEFAISTFTIEISGIDETPPEIFEIKSIEISKNSATITWKTNEKSTSQIEYGTTDSYGKETIKDENLVTSHSITITDLEPSTTYHFRVKSIDEAGNENISKDYTFKTSEETDELNIDAKLEIDNTKPKEGETINITAKVTNNGKTSIEINVIFYDNDKKITEKKITIASGKSGTSFCNWQAEGKGNHEIKVVIMYDGKEIKNVTDSKNVEVKEVADGDDSGFNMIYLIPVIIIPIVLVIGLVMRNKKGGKYSVETTTQKQTQIHTSQTQVQQSIPIEVWQKKHENHNIQPTFQPSTQSAYKTCPFCNAQVPIQFNFCNMCGKRLENNPN